MPRTKGAWIEANFNGSAIGRRGGPVRRRLASIDRFASRPSVIAAAKARGWLIIQFDAEWLIHQASIAVTPIIPPLAE